MGEWITGTTGTDGNGHGPMPSNDRKVRVALVGVGNCASSLVQGRYHYADAKAEEGSRP